MKYENRGIYAAALSCWILLLLLILRQPPTQPAFSIPKAPYPVVVLTNQAYLAGYDNSVRAPAWVCYSIPRSCATTGIRPRFFTEDARVNAPAPGAYTGTGYDRGHCAPSALIGALYGYSAQKETFKSSNILAQKPRLNRVIWAALEREELRYNNAYVVVGPVFTTKPLYRTNGIPVPDACYRIIVIADPLHFKAYVVPQTVDGTEPLSDFRTTVDAVEILTGLDFFSELPDELEEALEAL